MIRRPDELTPIVLRELDPGLERLPGVQEVPHAHQEPCLDWWQEDVCHRFAHAVRPRAGPARETVSEPVVHHASAGGRNGSERADQGCDRFRTVQILRSLATGWSTYKTSTMSPAKRPSETADFFEGLTWTT